MVAGGHTCEALVEDVGRDVGQLEVELDVELLREPHQALDQGPVDNSAISGHRVEIQIPVQIVGGPPAWIDTLHDSQTMLHCPT